MEEKNSDGLVFRTDLEWTKPLNSHNKSKGILTLGTPRKIKLRNGKEVELLPYLLDFQIKRGGTSKDDPRIARSNSVAIPLLASAYAKHYNESGLDEQWSEEEVIAMLEWHNKQSLGKFFLVKWAKDTNTGDVFPIGFISAYSKPYQSGNMLWDGELFVHPEFQKYGVGTELVEALLIIARDNNIQLFEALTYRDENSFPCILWEKYGCNPTDLIHIHGEINKMIEKINSKKR